MPLWLKIVVIVVALAAAGGGITWLLHSRALEHTLTDIETRSRRPHPPSPAPHALAPLPPPVQRYLAHALPNDGRTIRLARYTQRGQIRTATDSPTWMPFTASQLISPQDADFVWAARVRVAPLLHLQVRDALLQGIGSGRVLLMSALPLGASSGSPQMNAGSLHRFLAEAAWYPSALRPSPALQWAPIDERRAMATLTQGATTVSLEFRFNDANEISGIYTPGRWGNFDGAFRQQAWEGHFAGYRRVQGVLIPGEGEVGWYTGGQWRAVWRGIVDTVSFEFESQ